MKGEKDACFRTTQKIGDVVLVTLCSTNYGCPGIVGIPLHLHTKALVHKHTHRHSRTDKLTLFATAFNRSLNVH